MTSYSPGGAVEDNATRPPSGPLPVLKALTTIDVFEKFLVIVGMEILSPYLCLLSPTDVVGFSSSFPDNSE